MAVRVEINAPARLVRATIGGPDNLTLPEFEAFLDDLAARPDFRPGFDVLYDRRAVTQMPDPAFVRAALGAIESRAQQVAGGRWAVVIGSQAGLEVVRLTALLGERSGVAARPFVTPGEALCWLDEEERRHGVGGPGRPAAATPPGSG
jgi:hypothetical protein